MKRKLTIGLLILGACAVLFVASGFALGWLANRKQLRANQLPETAYQAIMSDSALTLISLDPDPLQAPTNEQTFGGYRVLGQTTVSDAALRRRLADTLRRGLGTWRYTYPSCFNPRHGLRAVLGDRTYEFVICFECGELQFSEPGFHGFGEGTAPGPFAEILTAANVPIAKSPFEQ